MNTESVERPGLGVIIIYALGQLGWSLAGFAAANLLVYFYMPPETGEAGGFPTFIFQGAILGVLTVIGLLNSGSRLFDAITDPLIANWSDRLDAKIGKRKFLMAISAIPFALLSFLLFYPISDDTITNTFWLFGVIFLFYLFMTLYVVPYTALISELGHHPDDRLKISTTISLTWAIGFLIGNSAYALQGLFEESMPSVEAFQTAIAIFAITALIFMLVPVFFLNEKKYCLQKQNDFSTAQALRSVFANRNFRFFTIADLMYWLSLTFIQMGAGYYIIVLMQLDKVYASTFLAIGLFTSFLFYWPINALAKRWGKRKLLSIAFPLFAILFGLNFFLDKLPIPTMVLFYCLAVFSAIPLAIFAILPNAIIADIVYEHESSTGNQQSAMFFGARNFMMKMGITLSNLIFPSLLLLGRSIENPWGIRLSALCACVFCIIGYLVFLNYEEAPPKLNE